MVSVYQAFDEEWLDKSLTAAESGEEQTPPSDEDIIRQRRPTLGHAKSTTNDESRHVQNSSTEEPASDAVTRLKEIKVQAAERLQAIRDCLDWLPDDVPDTDQEGETQWRTPIHQPKPMSAEDLMAAETVMRRGQANDRSVLGDLHARFTELMEEVEYLHGTPAPGAPGLLLCRHSDALHAGEPTCYDDKYTDMMHMYRYAADTATSIEDAAGIAFPHPRAVAKSWRVAERLAAAAIPIRDHNDVVWKITRFFRAFQTPQILYPWEILYTPSLGPGLPRPSNLGIN
jgi:hypothetical protein